MRLFNSIFLLLFTSIIFVSAYDVTDSYPADSSISFPINGQILVKFNEALNTSSFLSSPELLGLPEIEQGYSIPFYVVEKSYYERMFNTISFTQLLKVNGTFSYSDNKCIVTFTPDTNSLKYNTEYLILFDCLDSSNPHQIDPILFKTILEPHYLTSYQQNLDHQLLTCRDTLYFEYNRELPSILENKPDFVELYQMSGVHNTDTIINKIPVINTLSADKKILYVFPNYNFNPGEKLLLQVHNGLLTGSSQDDIEFRYSINDHFKVTLNSRVTNHPADFSDPSEVKTQVMLWKEVYKYGESVYIEVPKLIGDYFFSGWETNDSTILNFVNYNKIVNFSYDCSNAQSNLSITAIYEPLKVDTIVANCSENATIFVHGYKDSLPGGIYTKKRQIGNDLLVSILPDSNYAFVKWDNSDFFDINNSDSTSSNVFISTKAIVSNSGGLDFLEMMKESERKKNIGCPITEPQTDSYKFTVEISTQDEWEDKHFDYYSGNSHQNGPANSYRFAIECDSAYNPNAQSDTSAWCQIMRNFVTVTVDNNVILPNQWGVTGPSSINCGKSKWSKLKETPVFLFKIEILPPYDDLWEVDHIIVNDSRQWNNIIPYDFNHHDIYLNTLPYSDRTVASLSCKNVSLQIIARKKMHKLNYKIIPDTLSGFVNVDPEWQIVNNKETPLFYESTPRKSVNPVILASTGALNELNWIRYYHADKTVQLNPKNTPVMKNDPTKLDLEKLTWVTDTIGIVDTVDQSINILANYDKTAILKVKDIFRLVEVGLYDVSANNSNLPTWFDVGDLTENNNYLAKFDDENGLILFLKFNKDVNLSSVKRNIEIMDKNAIRKVDSSTSTVRFDGSNMRTYYTGNGNATSDTSKIFRVANNNNKVWITLDSTTYCEEITTTVDGIRSADNCDTILGGNSFKFHTMGPLLSYYLYSYKTTDDYDTGFIGYPNNEETMLVSGYAKLGPETDYEAIRTASFPQILDSTTSDISDTYVSIAPGNTISLGGANPPIYIPLARFEKRIPNIDYKVKLDFEFFENDCIDFFVSNCDAEAFVDSLSAISNLAAQVIGLKREDSYTFILITELLKSFTKGLNTVNHIDSGDIILSNDNTFDNTILWGLGKYNANKQNSTINQFNLTTFHGHQLVIQLRTQQF